MFFTLKPFAAVELTFYLMFYAHIRLEDCCAFFVNPSRIFCQSNISTSMQDPGHSSDHVSPIPPPFSPWAHRVAMEVNVLGLSLNPAPDASKFRLNMPIFSDIRSHQALVRGTWFLSSSVSMLISINDTTL